MGLQIAPEALVELGNRTGGDARQALNALEVAALLASGDERDTISLEDVAEALQRRIVRYDKVGDQHYDVISAFIKSVRGSDPDAALYWLFLMLEGGEDPEFIARRLIVLAAEDIGLADPHALPLAIAGSAALAYVGLPEAAYHLSETTIYLATAAKSNSVARAMTKARQMVTEGPAPSVPPHLRSAAYPGAEKLGHGQGYKYAHDYDGSIVYQQYFPDEVSPETIYQPGVIGHESEIKARMKDIDQVLRREGRD
jgi:putative ATPase